MRKGLFFLIPTLLLSFVCAMGQSPKQTGKDPYEPTPYVKIKHPEWSKDAVIYQINTRQFTQEGTFRAAEQHLPRLKELGVDILWLMPIHEIGQKNRKGTLGSPYAVKDYYSVNPEFGTVEDLKHFVGEAHKLGMHVILDWVANHTAWDNPLAAQHPDWYDRNWKGEFRPTPWFDWTDIINLNYNSRDLRKYMTDVMKYWVRDVGVDGYRCDVAGFVPVEFWNNLRRELDAIKPVFMLAEWESRDLHAEAFDMTYAWSWYEAMHNIAKGKADVGALYGYYSWNEGFHPRGGMRMLFLSNHDKNSWEGTEFEQFGDAVEVGTILSFVSEGMPLIYNGQEAGNTKRLQFFEKDPLVWKEHANGALFKKLIKLKKANPALWNAPWGAQMIHVPNSANNHVLSFVRMNGANKIFAVFNLSKEARTVKFEDKLHHGTYTEYLGGKQESFDDRTELSLPAWSCRVYLKQ